MHAMENLQNLHKEKYGVDVYLNKLTGKEVYSSRT